MIKRSTRMALAAGLTAGLLLAATASAGPAEVGPVRERFKARMAERLQDKKAEEARPIDLQAILPGARMLTQGYGPDARQQIDVYLPPGVENAPIIVMVHGGAWKIGDKANTGSVENKLKYWLPKGFIFVSVNYRMLPQAMAYDQAQDVANAVRWTQAQARDWGGDAQKLVLMGHSAGAHLVALLSSNPAMVGQSWAGTVVLDSAVMRVSDTLDQRHPKFYDEAFGSDPAYWAKTSPADQWTPAAVPMILVCSRKRPDKPCEDAKAFADLTGKAGRKTLVLPQDLTHADINRTLGLPSSYTSAVDDFITARLKSGR